MLARKGLSTFLTEGKGKIHHRYIPIILDDFLDRYPNLGKLYQREIDIIIDNPHYLTESRIYKLLEPFTIEFIE